MLQIMSFERIEYFLEQFIANFISYSTFHQ